MKKILIGFITLISVYCEAQTYECNMSSLHGATKKIDQRFTVLDDAVSITIISNGKADSLYYKKLASTNPAVIYFQKDEVTSSLTIVHSAGSMKGMKYTDVLSLKKDLQAEEPVGLWYCTSIQQTP